MNKENAGAQLTFPSFLFVLQTNVSRWVVWAYVTYNHSSNGVGDMEPTSGKDTVEKEEVGASGEVKRDLLQDSTDPQLLSPPAEFPETCHLL